MPAITFLLGVIVTRPTVNKAGNNTSALLTVPETALDFGEAGFEQHFTWRFPITNTGRQSIDVVKLEGSCKCTAVEPAMFTLPPGETQDVKLTFDLYPSTEKDLSKPERPFAVTLTAHYRPSRPGAAPTALRGHDEEGLETAHTVEWQVRGRIVNPYKIEPRYVAFGDSLIAGREFPSKTVDVSCGVPPENFTARCEPDLAQVSISDDPARPGRYQLHITPRADLPPADHEFSVLLEGTRPDGKALPQIPVPVLAHVQLPVRARPPRVLLGLVRAGDTLTKEIHLESLVREPFEIVETRADQPDAVQVAHSREMPTALRGHVAGTASTRHTYRITVTPSTLGHFVTHVTFVVRPAGADSPRGGQGARLGDRPGETGTDFRRPTGWHCWLVQQWFFSGWHAHGFAWA